MKKLWEWFSGNKTIIGALILAILGTQLIPEHTFLYQFLLWIGGLLAGTGVVHKILKRDNEK